MLILEDDVLLMPHFETRLMKLWRSYDDLRNSNSSSSRPHLFTMLGFMSNGQPHREVVASFPDSHGRQGGGVTDSVVLPSQTIGFFGYAVTPAAAAGTLRALLPLRQAMDSALHHSFPALAANNVQARRTPALTLPFLAPLRCLVLKPFEMCDVIVPSPQVIAFDASTRMAVLDRTHYTGILSYEPRFKSDIPRVKGQPHTDPARPVVAVTHPRNGSTVSAGADLHLELILLNVMEDETLLRAAVDGELVIGTGVPNLSSRNFISVAAPPPPGGWFSVELSLVSFNIMTLCIS